MTQDENHEKTPRQNGGKRPGAGRPRGARNQFSMTAVLEEIRVTTGSTFVELLAQGYKESIENNDKYTRLKYENMLINKLVADKHNVDIVDNTPQARALLFNQALLNMTNPTIIDVEAKSNDE